jgi:hypothetical protein
MKRRAGILEWVGLIVGVLFTLWLILNGVHEFLKPTPPTVCQSLAAMPSDPTNPDQPGMVADCFNENQP